MTKRHLTRLLASPDATETLACAIAPTLGPGDVILLEGEIGAGKTHFSRALIQSLMDLPEDVPSPTFTLVQTYELAAGELWHADLYRLSSLDEIDELGLLSAFDEAICLIEWPDRLEEERPQHALTLKLAPLPDQDEARSATLMWQDAKWDARLAPLAGDPNHAPE